MLVALGAFFLYKTLNIPPYISNYYWHETEQIRKIWKMLLVLADKLISEPVFQVSGLQATETQRPL